METFDLDGYRAAVLSLDAERWLAYYATDAVWTEYRHADPPRAPHVMRGHAEIGPFLRAVSSDPFVLRMDNEVVGTDRLAYTLTITLPDDRRIIENVILEHHDGLITNQTEVEAWD